MTLRRYAVFFVIVAFLGGALLTFGFGRGMCAAEPEEAPAAAAESPGLRAARRVVERYLGLENYADTFYSERAIVVVDDQGTDVLRDVRESSGTLTLARPDKLAMTMGEAGAIYTDGKTVWFHRPTLKQYKALELDDIDRLVQVLPAMTDVAHPALLSLGGLEVDEVLKRIEITGFVELSPEQKVATLEGRAELPLGGLPSQDPLDFTATFDTETGLLREFTLDLSDVLKQSVQQSLAQRGIDRKVTVQRGQMSLRFEDVEVDGDLPAETFTYKPPEEFEEVDRFGPQGPAVGEAAPDFIGTTLAGETVKLSDLRGNVVIMDFWATWCHPCLRALPHIQSLATEFADQPLVVLGINQDRPGSEKQVRAFVANKGLSFTQVMDEDHSIGRKYQVQAIPRTVVIGPEGRIRHSQAGFGPESAEALRAKIKALLDEPAAE